MTAPEQTPIASARPRSGRGLYGAVLLYLLVAAMSVALSYYDARRTALAEMDRELMLGASAAASLLEPAPGPGPSSPAQGPKPGALLRGLAALGGLTRLYAATRDGLVVASSDPALPDALAGGAKGVLSAALAETADTGRPRFVTYGERGDATRAALIPAGSPRLGRLVIVAERPLSTPGERPRDRALSVLALALVLSLSLVPIVTTALRRLRDSNAELRQELAELDRSRERLPSLDELTGQYNRPGFERLLGQELARCKRHGQACAVAVLEVDGLKRLTARHGLSAADAVIMQSAARIAASLRGCDVLGRLAGGRFGLILPETEVTNAAIAAERVRRQLAATPIGLPGAQQSIPVTATVGVAAIQREDAGADALSRAQQRLDQGIREGRDRVVAG